MNFFSYIIPDTSYHRPEESMGGKEKDEGTFFEKGVSILCSNHVQQNCYYFFFIPHWAFLSEQDLPYVHLLLLPILCVSTELEPEVWMGINALFFAYRKIRHYVSISRLCNDNNKVSKNDDMLTLAWAQNTAKQWKSSD